MPVGWALATLPTAGSPGGRLLIWLVALDSTDAFIGDEVRLETFLANAVHLSKPRGKSPKLNAFLTGLQE